MQGYQGDELSLQFFSLLERKREKEEERRGGETSRWGEQKGGIGNRKRKMGRLKKKMISVMRLSFLYILVGFPDICEP